MNSDLLSHPLVRRGFDSIPLGGFAYLATPYTLVDHQWAVERASWWQAHLAQVYRVVTVSPVVMGHYMEPHLPEWEHEDWMAFCLPMLEKARCLVVPPVIGWGKSAGIAEEMDYALARNMPVVLG